MKLGLFPPPHSNAILSRLARPVHPATGQNGTVGLLRLYLRIHQKRWLLWSRSKNTGSAWNHCISTARTRKTPAAETSAVTGAEGARWSATGKHLVGSVTMSSLRNKVDLMHYNPSGWTQAEIAMGATSKQQLERKRVYQEIQVMMVEDGLSKDAEAYRRRQKARTHDTRGGECNSTDQESAVRSRGPHTIIMPMQQHVCCWQPHVPCLIALECATQGQHPTLPGLPNVLQWVSAIPYPRASQSARAISKVISSSALMGSAAAPSRRAGGTRAGRRATRKGATMAQPSTPLQGACQCLDKQQHIRSRGASGTSTPGVQGRAEIEEELQ